MTSIRHPLAAAILIISAQLPGIAFCQANSASIIPKVDLAQVEQAKSTVASPSVDALAAGAEIFENLTESSTELNAAAFKDAMAKFETLYPNISTLLTSDRKKRLGVLVDGVRTSWQKKDRGSMAIESIEIYRLLQESINHSGQPIPAEVPLLDYAGFKIKALLISKHPNWTKIHKTAQEATQWWTSIKPKVTDNSLRDAMDHTIVGINNAANLKDPNLLVFAAEMDLILVDGLEAFFNSHASSH